MVYIDGDGEDLTRAQIIKLLIPIDIPRYKNTAHNAKHSFFVIPFPINESHSDF